MAHYLAERLNALETLHGESRAEAEEHIAGLIVQLWQQRENAAFRIDPTSRADAIERAIERLDPKRPAWSYHRPFEELPSPTATEIDVNALLNLALRIDDLSGRVVRDLVSLAATTAMEQEATWAAAVRAAQLRGSFWTLERLLEQYGTGESAVLDQTTVQASTERLIQALQETTSTLQECGVVDQGD